MHRPAGRGDVDQEDAEQAVGQALVRVEQLDVIEIPRVLPVQSGVQLASVEILERDHLHLGKAECILDHVRSEEHTYELQSLMRISYAVFCLKTKKQPHRSKLHLTQQFTLQY